MSKGKPSSGRSLVSNEPTVKQGPKCWYHLCRIGEACTTYHQSQPFCARKFGKQTHVTGLETASIHSIPPKRTTVRIIPITAQLPLSLMLARFSFRSYSKVWHEYLKFHSTSMLKWPWGMKFEELKKMGVKLRRRNSNNLLFYLSGWVLTNV